jgi:putative tryptophan/tyrosine transport system substrate-binding protein
MRRRGFITRRAFIVLLALTVAPLPALAQEPRKIRHIGFLRVGPPPPAFIDGFRRGLRELGYIEGQHFVIEYGSTIDPVAAGLVASLARPGKNITGMTSISGDVIAKRLQMITELLPGLTRVALLVRETSPDTGQYVRESQTAARNLGIELQVEIERKPKDLEGIFAAAQGAGAVVVADDAEFTSQRDQIAELALKNRLPTMSGLRELGRWSDGLWR